MNGRFGQRHAARARGHARRRAEERSGWALSEPQIRAHEQAIRNFETQIHGYGADRREFHEIEAEGGNFFAVWCPHLQQIVTYLSGPEQWRGGFLRRAS